MRLPLETSTSPYLYQALTTSSPPSTKNLPGAILESEKTLGTSHEIKVLPLVLLPLPLFPAIIFMVANVCGTFG